MLMVGSPESAWLVTMTWTTWTPKQSDVAASGRGIWAVCLLGEDRGRTSRRGIDGGGDRAGLRWTGISRGKKENGDAGGAQLDILADRMMRTCISHILRWWGWCRCGCRFCFLRAGGTDFLRGLAMKAGHSGWDANGMLQLGGGGRWLGVAMEPRAVCGDEMLVFLLFGIGGMALTRGPVALIGEFTAHAQMLIHVGAQDADVDDGAFCCCVDFRCWWKMEVHRWKCGAGTRHEASSAGGSMRVGKEVEK